ncbi:MAG: hypothetical protein SV760_09250 [Halobacteria archaeon]|nr:hypothetical protein [Halobacteria archaeon]
MADDFGITLDPAQGRIDTDSGVIETDESFSIGITNEGSPTHVHFSLSDPLRKHLTLEGNNIYVEDSETVGVVVGPLSETVEGTLEITAEYGSHTEEVRVVLGGKSGDDDAGLGSAIGATVSGGGGEEMEVDVDESLSQPVDVDYDRLGDALGVSRHGPRRSWQPRHLHPRAGRPHPVARGRLHRSRWYVRSPFASSQCPPSS